jgi:hypothetical protein
MMLRNRSDAQTPELTDLIRSDTRKPPFAALRTRRKEFGTHVQLSLHYYQ